jgi:BirA family biotin operon repressor/biotin-[acetyl-CoA-carboxylase] ligase
VPETGAGAAAAGHRLEHVPAIGSTNAVLIERAREGETGPLWLVADRQEQGRGRNARPWSSPEGNLYASLLLTDPAPAAHVSELSFVLSLALRDAVLAAAGMLQSPVLTLKWPNDVMAEGMKTAGLLLEGGGARGVSFVVAGFGVNIVSHPEGTPYKATDLRAAGFAVDRDGLLRALTDAVVARLVQWDRGAGFEAIRRDWIAVAHGRNGPLRVNTLSESFEGVFEAIDAGGRLIVMTPAGRRTVSAGDVFVLPQAGDAA